MSFWQSFRPNNNNNNMADSRFGRSDAERNPNQYNRGNYNQPTGPPSQRNYDAVQQSSPDRLYTNYNSAKTHDTFPSSTRDTSWQTQTTPSNNNSQRNPRNNINYEDFRKSSMTTNNWPQPSHERNQYGRQQQSTSTYDDNQRPSMNCYANTRSENANANARETVATSRDGFLRPQQNALGSSQHVSELRKVLSRITGAQESRNYVADDDDEPTRRNNNDFLRNKGYNSLELPYNNSTIKNVLERRNDVQNSKNIPERHKAAALFNKDYACERRRDDDFRSRRNDIPAVIDLQGRSNFQGSNHFSEMQNVGPFNEDNVAESRRDDDFRRNDIPGMLDFEGRSNFQGSNISKMLNVGPINKDNFAERRRDDDFISRRNDIPRVVDFQGRSNFQGSNNFSKMQNLAPINNDNVDERHHDDDYRSGRYDIPGMMDFQSRNNFPDTINVSKMQNVGPDKNNDFGRRFNDFNSGNGYGRHNNVYNKSSNAVLDVSNPQQRPDVGAAFTSRNDRNEVQLASTERHTKLSGGALRRKGVDSLQPKQMQKVAVITKSRSGDRMANEASSEKRQWKRNSDIKSSAGGAVGKMHDYQRSEDRRMMFEPRRNNRDITNRNSATSFANKRRRLDHNNDEKDEANDVFSDDDDGVPKRSDLDKNILPNTKWKYPSACRDEILTHILQGSSFKPHAKPKVPTKSNPIIYWREWWAKYAYIEKKIERINDNDEYIRHKLKYQCVDINDGKEECIAFIKLACNRFQKHTQALNENNFQHPEHLYKLLKYQILLLDLYINFPSYMDKTTCQDIRRVLHGFNKNKDKLALVHQNVISKWHSYTELVRKFENAEISLSDRVTQAYTALNDRLFIYFVNKSIKDLKKISLNDLAII